jgi:hypothetical protein
VVKQIDDTEMTICATSAFKFSYSSGITVLENTFLFGILYLGSRIISTCGSQNFLALKLVVNLPPSFFQLT